MIAVYTDNNTKAKEEVGEEQTDLIISLAKVEEEQEILYLLIYL